MAALVLFLLIVAVSFLRAALLQAHRPHRPVRLEHLRHHRGEREDGATCVQQGGGGLGLGETPIGPTWHSNYFLGADNQGRDVVARVLYGGRASLLIGIGSALICCLLALVFALARRLLRRLARLGRSRGDGPDLGVPRLPARDLASRPCC